jgi:hypothetical protein
MKSTRAVRRSSDSHLSCPRLGTQVQIGMPEDSGEFVSADATSRSGVSLMSSHDLYA